MTSVSRPPSGGCTEAGRGGATRRGLLAALLAGGGGAMAAGAARAQDDPLPSWRDGATRRAVLEFVAAVTTEGGGDYVRPAERVAVFDNDGTLWVEQPMYTQVLFLLDRLRELAPRHPAWADDPVFRAALAGDLKGAAAEGTRGLLRLAGAAFANVTPEAFEAIAAAWLATARDHRWHRPYTTLVYQPMLEVLALLRARGFACHIVTGGGVEFVRAFADGTYGVPRERVVGSTFTLEPAEQDGRLVLIRQPHVDFVDDGPGKPIGIARHIGRRPIAAFGNSDGDFEMLRYTTEGPGRRLGLIVHHDDAAREYAYDRLSHVGRLDRALDEAPRRGWHLASMRDDWARVFAWEA
jgi:phosphoglycolate phosphatase-like HAD superfamily hydrolase